MNRKEALSYIKSAAGHLIVTERKVMGMALLEAWDALRQPETVGLEGTKTEGYDGD